MQSIPAMVLAHAATQVAEATESAPEALREKIRGLRIDQNFLLFPINNESSSRQVQLVKSGRVLRSFKASLGLPAQWWAHLDVSEWRGQTLTIAVSADTSPEVEGAKALGRGANETPNAELIAAVRTSAELWSPETIYKEPLRPAIHFSAKRGWNNDPNGLMYHAGQYHMFFQHNPYGVRWGNMHWGHAVSTDLVHWRELPIALYPRGDRDFPFSGCGIVDHDNTSGWAKDGEPPMVIVFTSTGRGECIAYSQDKGASWKEFEGNPVIKHQGRDPKVFWYPGTKQWVMAVYSERPAAEPASPPRQGIAFYTSTDLKSWQQQSWIDCFYECPDLFALPVDGDHERTKWVLSCAPGYYHIGEFDGSRFTPESSRLPAPSCGIPGPREGLVAHPLLYAAQTFDNHPQGHRVQIAWGRVHAVDAPFTQLMSFPTTLSLRTTSDGLRLCREPVDAIRSLRKHTYDFPAGPLKSSSLLSDLEGEAWDIEAEIEVGNISAISLRIGGEEYLYQSASQMLKGPSGSMLIPQEDRRVKFRILVDRTTVEVFGDRGQAYGMFVRTPVDKRVQLELRAVWGDVRIERLRVCSLQPAWSVSQLMTDQARL